MLLIFILKVSLSSNCLEGPRYFEWDGWKDSNNSLASRWAPAVNYHVGFKWLWLNHGQTNDTKITIETIHEVKFADQLLQTHGS